MEEMIVFLGLVSYMTTVPIAYAYSERRYDVDFLEKIKNKPHANPRHILRLSPPSKIKTRPPSFQADSKLERVQQFSICNTNAEGGANMNKKGNTYAGSKSLTFSEKGDDVQKLVCKTKAYRMMIVNGVLKRVAVDSSAVLSNDKNVLGMLDNQKQLDPNKLEVAGIGRSSIKDSAGINDAVSALNTDVDGAKAKISSKSRKSPGVLETASSAEGRTILKEGVKGTRTWGKEKTRLSTKRQYGVRSHSGRSSGQTLAQLSHRKRTDFEIEI